MFKKTLVVAATTLLAVSAVSASAQGPCPSSLNANEAQSVHHAVCQAVTSLHFILPEAPEPNQNAAQPIAGLQPTTTTKQPLTSVSFR